MVIFKNPLYAYAMSFLVAFGVYHLGWAEFYPELTFEVKVFLLFTIITSVIFGKLLGKFGWINFTRKQFSGVNICLLNCNKIVSFLYLMLLLEAIFCGGLPLIGIITQANNITYVDFGIPSFHVVFFTFKNFYLSVLFWGYLHEKNKTYIYYYIVVLIIDVFIVNRADILCNLLAALSMYAIFNHGKKYQCHMYLKLILAILVVLFLFGVFGNYRSSVAFGFQYTSDLILTIGQATDTFKESFIPDEFFWSYIYISSPLANLQHIMDVYSKYHTDYLMSLDDFWGTLGYGVLPNFLSKRIMPELGYEYPVIELLVDKLNVSTMYASSCYYMGVTGMLLHFFALIFVVYINLYVFSNNRYSFIVTSILVVMCIFSMFNNFLSSVGWMGQIFYIFLLTKTRIFEGFLYKKGDVN